MLARALVLIPSCLFAALAAPLALGEEPPAQQPPPAVPADDLQSLFERHLEAKDEPAIEALFRARPFEVIHLIDGYLEAWLSSLERPDEAKGRDVAGLLERALAGARIADEVFQTDAFGRYAHAWKDWSAEQRRQFRAGQGAFGKGRNAMKEKELGAAKAAFEESLALADPLGDLWGVAQAEAALGDIAYAEERFDEAVTHHERAARVWGSLKHDAMLRSLRALGVLHEKNGNLELARASLEKMVAAADEAGRPEAAAPVKKDLARICRELGDEEAAKRWEG